MNGGSKSVILSAQTREAAVKDLNSKQTLHAVCRAEMKAGKQTNSEYIVDLHVNLHPAWKTVPNKF